MKAFDLLELHCRYAVTGICFMALAVHFAVCVYKWMLRLRRRTRAADIVLFAIGLSLLSWMSAAIYRPKDSFPVPLPWGVFALGFVLLTGYAALELYHTMQDIRQRPYAGSVRQALDNLNSAVCFADENDRIILCNRLMNALCFERTGSYPRNLADLESLIACEQPVRGFADDSVWVFRRAPLPSDELRGYTQVTGQDVTGVSALNDALHTENEKLRETNKALRQTMERLADRVREEETLHIKTQVHNEIGTSLIAISRIMREDSNADVDKQLRNLQNAVSFFSSARIDPQQTDLEEAVIRARNMGVALIIEGNAGEYENVIAAAATECVRNCINHADGDRVHIAIKPESGGVKVLITNNGNPPKGPIAEGTGLSGIRRKVTRQQGIMKVYDDPDFILELYFPQKENLT